VAGSKGTRDPQVVGRVGTQDNRSTLRGEELGSLDDVEDKGVYLLAGLAGGADLCAGPSTDGTTVVIGPVGAANIIVAELNYNRLDRPPMALLTTAMLRYLLMYWPHPSMGELPRAIVLSPVR
jgi:hypothetical protein